VTTEVEAAFEEEMAARARLPADTRALVVVLAEIGRGGMSQAAITIERARGAIADSLAEPAGDDSSRAGTGAG
jgi:hypothetical protein